MNKLRRWLIYKLGGLTVDGIQYKEVVNEYWDKVHVSKSLYISPCDYMEKNAESIERELATQIGEELLRKGCVFFGGPYKDRDELRIGADCTALKLHTRQSYHMPNRLVFKGDTQHVQES